MVLVFYLLILAIQSLKKYLGKMAEYLRHS